MSSPPNFGIEFLDWFKKRTEQYWAAHEPRSLDDYRLAGAGGTDWQRGTRWVDGLTDESIHAIEHQWHLTFPPDYRLFLQHLHCVDRLMVGAFFTGDGEHTLEPGEKPSFHNWLEDMTAVQQKFDCVRDGLEFDIEHNELWLGSWGAKPNSLDKQKEVLRNLLKQAPPLVPVFGHRYLVADPAVAGNPVISVCQSDIIVYGSDLRSYLLIEFAHILGEPASAPEPSSELIASYLAIPFWGELLATGYC